MGHSVRHGTSVAPESTDRRAEGGNCVGMGGGPGDTLSTQINCFLGGLGENEEAYGVSQALHETPFGATLEKTIFRTPGSGPGESCWQSRN